MPRRELITAVLVGTLACATACTSFQPIAGPLFISSKAIEVRFRPPRDLEGRTANGVVTSLPSVRRVRGVVRGIARDTVVVEARSIEPETRSADMGEGWLRLSPPVELRVATVDPGVRLADRRFSYFNTALGAVAAAPFAIALFYVIACSLTGCFN